MREDANSQLHTKSYITFVKLVDEFDESIAESNRLWSYAQICSAEIDRIMANYDEILEKERMMNNTVSIVKKGGRSRKPTTSVSRKNSKNT